VAGGKTAVADEVPAREKGLDKPETNGVRPVAGVAGAFGNNGQEDDEADLEELFAVEEEETS
jgi:hypothetical protein